MICEVLQVDALAGPGALANLPGLGDVILAGHKESPFLLAAPCFFQEAGEDIYDHDHTLSQKREYLKGSK